MANKFTFGIIDRRTRWRNNNPPLDRRRPGPRGCWRHQWLWRVLERFPVLSRGLQKNEAPQEGDPPLRNRRPTLVHHQCCPSWPRPHHIQESIISRAWCRYYTRSVYGTHVLSGSVLQKMSMCKCRVRCHWTLILFDNSEPCQNHLKAIKIAAAGKSYVDYM